MTVIQVYRQDSGSRRSVEFTIWDRPSLLV